jgi:hypothetical protein
MRLTRSLLCVSWFLLAIQPVSAHAAGPGATVERFYASYIANRQGGLPEGKELKRLAPFLSQRLHGLIVDALAYREAWTKRHPPEPSPDGGAPVVDKPPFVDGDYFTSLFEGPKRFKVGSAEGDDVGGWKVRVHFWYEAGSEGWEDVVLVRKENGRYVIDDVLLSGAGPFNPPGRLSDALTARDED